MRPVARHAKGRADRHLAVGDRINRESDAWKEVQPFVAVVALPANVVGIAGKDHARWRVGKHRTAVALSEQLGIDKVNLAPLAGWRHIRLPPHAIVQREATVCLPGILRIEGLIILARVEPVYRALR